MNECTRFEELLRERDVSACEEMAEHLERCPDCQALLEDWVAISREAKELFSPIDTEGSRESILGEVERELGRQERARRRRPWLVAAAAAFLMSLGMATFWLQVDHPTDPLDDWLIRNSALEDVERSEERYRESIERLAAIVDEAEPAESSPRLSALQDKLLLLDQAIEECETLVEDNPYHAELRQQLLTVYRQKDQTLREILEAR